MNSLFEVLKAAWERRESLRTEGRTDAYRVSHGEADALPGITIDNYGGVWIIQWFEDQCPWDRKAIDALAGYAVEELSARSVYLKPHVSERFRFQASELTFDPQPLAGSEVEPQFVIEELGRKYWIRPYDGYSVGLFLDQRENRDFLSKLPKLGQVLNGFCYTGGFSVAVALSGAMVTSVDVSKKALESAKSNFRLNDLEPGAHRFFADDMKVHLKRASQKPPGYDLIILDPPSFGRNRKGQTFSLSQDLDEMVRNAAQCLSPGGLLFCSCNFLKWSPSEFREVVQRAFGRGELMNLPNVPLDFAGPELRAILLKK